jgi:hypothetical protein
MAAIAQNVNVNADKELEKVLNIARHIGATSGDQVNLSYTSILIGLLWSDDATSAWIQERVQSLAVRTTAIYANGHIEETQRSTILNKVSSGEVPTIKDDEASVSALTVLNESQSLAIEAGWPPNSPIGTRHVAAVYFFRNPPAHVRQLADWGFDKDVWRYEFATFIATTYPQESTGWTQILAGYLPSSDIDPVSQQVDGTFLGNFVFETECVSVMRGAESAAVARKPSIWNSEGLLHTLVQVRTVPDCAAFGDLVRDRLAIQTTITLPTSGLPFQGTGSTYPATRGFKNILDRARSLARSTTSTDAVGVRHIIASILVDPDSTANQKLIQSGASLPLLRNKLLKHFTRSWLNDDSLQWQLILVGSTLPTITDVQGDSADRGEDRLNVSRHARAFATVITAQKVNPPFSIGIFGDWGSGKSFFMRLMMEHTKALTSFEDVGQDGNRLFCRRVEPIIFNAWHYAETELLASLVQTILMGLRTAIVGRDGDSELMDKVLSELEIAKVVRGEAEKNLTEAKQERDNSAQTLSELSRQADGKATVVQRLKATDVANAVRKAILPKLCMDDAVALGERYLGLQGLGKLKETKGKAVGEIVGIIEEVRIARLRARSAWEWLLRAPIDWGNLAPWLVGGLAVLVAALTATIWLHTSWPAFYGFVLNIAALLALTLGWAKRQLRSVSSGLDQFDSLRREIDHVSQKEQQKAHSELATATQEHQGAVAAVGRAQVDLKEAQLRVEKAEQEVQESHSINQIAKLLEDRLTGKTYERYLGVVAAVRSDFQRLSELMKRMRKDEQSGNDALRPVDRIVLYIDDLDRCPTHQVVAVLEAIHLLLSFELFVVVVGVDIRWAAKSLAEKYPLHLTPGIYEGGQSSYDANQGVSALDYLEKIFQIPFWLPPMEENASRSMIAEMVPRLLEIGATAQIGIAPESPVVNDTGEGKPSEQPAAVSPSGDEQRRNAQSLVIEPEERLFMLQLAGAVGKSPRRLKRFVNSYRILKASLDNLQQETFVVKRGSSGEYRAAMVLLAIITAAPRSSLGIVDFLANSKDDAPLSQLEAHVQRLIDPGETSYVQAALSAFKTAQSDAPLATLRTWAPEVARFSFRSGRM